MNDMPLPPRLIKRGNVYWFRSSIPRDIKDSYPKTEETFSLGTRDYQDALKKLRKASAEVDGRFDAHRQLLSRQLEPALPELTDAQIKHVEEVYFAHLLDEDEEVRLEGFEGGDFEEYVGLVEDMDSVNRHDITRGVRPAFAKSEAEEVLTWTNIDLKLDPVSTSWPKVIRAILKASIRASEVKRQRNDGNPIETPAMPEAKSERAGPIASDIMKEWVAEKSRAKGGWTPKTAEANQIWTKRFIEVAGDKPMSGYLKADARAFKAALLSLPPNWTKVKVLEKLSMREAAEMASSMSAEPMAGRNVNKILGFVRAFWNWAGKNYDDVPPNPFDGMNVKISGKVRDERHPFSRDELSSILHSPIYTGCKSVRYHNTPGDLIPSDQGIYWVPLVALFTGCRSGEIIQLRTEDVKVEGGVAYLTVTDEADDQNIKTSESGRRIPIHKTLKDIGFLRFVERQRKRKQARLFPELPKATDGTYSTAYSTKFGNTLKALGIKHDKNAFHSFRHSFEDVCRNSRIPLDFINALQGHSGGGMANRYGHGLYGLQLLSEEMAKVQYDDLDLSHLIAARA